MPYIYSINFIFYNHYKIYPFLLFPMKFLYFILLFFIVSQIYADDDFSSDQYQSLSAKDKMSKLWSEITADQTELGFYGPLTIATIFLEDMHITFNHVSDSFPPLRKKLIHTVGVIAQGELVVDPSNPYTGVFEGVNNVLIRLSIAKQADFTKTTAAEALDNFTPGMSLKFLRDGLSSANLVAMYGVNGFPSWNFFGRDFSNHIPGAEGLALKAVACKFAQATNHVQTVGLKDMASYNQKGEDRRGDLNFPFKLVFKPTSQVNTLFPDDFVQSYMDQLKTIKVGTQIYDVYAVNTPDDAEVKIGTLRTTSEFVSSHWGDEKLWFQHGIMEDDLSVHPEWTDKTPSFSLLSAIFDH